MGGKRHHVDRERDMNLETPLRPFCPPASSAPNSHYSHETFPARQVTKGLFSQFQYIYRVRQVVVDLGWVDFDFNIPSSSPSPQPILPNLQLPKQNGAGSGTPKINVNPT